MKLLAINGSPRKEGNTSQALKMVMVELEKEGIETEMLNIGGAPVKECIACGMGAKHRDEKWV
ncbi:MAG: NAD(P)H-dependent oxidoreductase [Clostridiaceae bacterium]